METTQIERWKIEYTDMNGLDCECDFCKRNSYKKNFHFLRNKVLELVVCEECLNKIKEMI